MPSSVVAVREIGSACVLVPPRHVGTAAGEALSAAAETALLGTPAVLVVDFSGVENLNSAGIGALFYVARRARTRAVPVVLAGLSGQPRVVVDQVRLPLYVPVHDTVEDAIASRDREEP